MKQKLHIRRGFTLVELLVVIVIIAALAGLTAPMVIRQRKKADQTEAVNNAKQIGLAMFEFENAFGSFPDGNATISQITAGDFTIASPSTSNDYFRQLMAAEISQSEAMFYAKAGYSKKPDNVYLPSGTALAPGEVGFGYIMNDTEAFSTSGNPSRPIVVAPLAFAAGAVATDGKFDVDMYDSKAVVLRIDNSVQSLNVTRSTQQASLGGNATLLTGGASSVWGTDVSPTIVPPDKK
jgi:prepilin-type N-terminal cleavage/methylation domain-containing protein